MMTTEFSHNGLWFLPENPDKKVAGVLTFNLKNDPELVLFGTFYENRRDPIHEPLLILGQTTTAKYISLYKSSEGLRSMHNGVMSSVYSALYVFFDCHFFNEEAVKFTKVRATFKNINDWVKKYGFDVNHNFEANEIDVHYKRPDDIHIKINETLTCAISFNHWFPWSGSVHELKISQQAYFQIDSVVPLSLFETLDNLMLFQNFLTLAIFEPSYPMSIGLTIPTLEKEVQSSLVYKPGFDYNPKSSRGVFLFQYDDIAFNFQTIVQNWFSFKSTLAPVIDLVLNSFYNRNLNVETRFLHMAQALETFHRRYKNKEPFDKKEYKAWVRALVETVDDKYREMLKGKLDFANEQPLHARIEECISNLPIETIQTIVGDKKKFIGDVKNSRNYYTHFSQSLEKKALKGNMLYQVTDKLRIVLIATILSEAGFELTQIDALISKNGIYLFNHIYKPSRN